MRRLEDNTLVETAALPAVLLRLREEMLHAAEELRFEDAARLRDRLRQLEQLELAR